jgi:hypothetical protein
VSTAPSPPLSPTRATSQLFRPKTPGSAHSNWPDGCLPLPLLCLTAQFFCSGLLKPNRVAGTFQIPQPRCPMRHRTRTPPSRRGFELQARKAPRPLAPVSKSVLMPISWLPPPCPPSFIAQTRVPPRSTAPAGRPPECPPVHRPPPGCPPCYMYTHTPVARHTTIYFPSPAQRQRGRVHGRSLPCLRVL